MRGQRALLRLVRPATSAGQSSEPNSLVPQGVYHVLPLRPLYIPLSPNARNSLRTVTCNLFASGRGPLAARKPVLHLGMRTVNGFDVLLLAK